jgi:hypothetical protein
MSKVLICISDASDAANTKTRIVDANSRAEILAEILDDTVNFLDENDTLAELVELLEDEDTYINNNLPCEIEQIYSLGVIY